MVEIVSASADGSRFLSLLPKRDIESLDPFLTAVDLPVGKVLEQSYKAVEYIYFLNSGIATVVAEANPQKRSEIGLIGNEGMSGVVVTLGNHSSPHTTYMQIEGYGQRIGADDFNAILAKSSSLRSQALKYAQSFFVQTASTSYANAHASLKERLARWLLMAHDRLDSNDIHLTHEFLSIILGVRRAGVTVALNDLVSQGSIKSQRALITILNRESLLEIAGPYYGVAETEYKRLMT